MNKKNEWKVKRHGEDGEVWKKDMRDRTDWEFETEKWEKEQERYLKS